MKIEISQEDYEFLKDLKNELNTQTTDGNAQPVFWGISEIYEECRGGGDFGGEPRIVYDDGNYTLKEAIENVEQALDNETYGFGEEERERWKEVDKNDAEEVCEYMRNTLGGRNSIYYVAYVEKVRRVSEYTGAFLTKRACKNYIEKYGYNHNSPHTYAMTAYRNFELERLLKILRSLDFKEN